MQSASAAPALHGHGWARSRFGGRYRTRATLGYRADVRTLLVVLGLTLAGCPSNAGSQGAPAAERACTRIGQTCQVAPGKLGTCVQRDECTQGACFVCQSQH